MRFHSTVLCVAFVLSRLHSEAAAGVVFEDGFEAETPGPAWGFSFLNQGRTGVSRDHEPATGQAHLILDDSVSDALFSAAEATLTLDLSNKKEAVLSFKAKSLGNEPHPPPEGNFTGIRSYDGVAVSADGGVTWRAVHSLAGAGGAWESFSIDLDPAMEALSGSYGPDFRIRFSAYDNAPAPLDGLAIDDVSVTAVEDQRSLLELPSTVTEGGGPYTGHVLLAFPPAADLTLRLVHSANGQLVLPDTVIVPAGQTSASFEFSAVDDELVNLSRSISVSAEADEVTAAAKTVLILDNEAPVFTLTLPARLVEGPMTPDNASLTLSRAPAVPIVVKISASPADQLHLPPSVTVPAGQTRISFTAIAVNDWAIDGDVPVTVTASAPGMTSATAVTTAVDDEARTLTLSLPSAVMEGGAAEAAVTVPGTLEAALRVTLTTSSEAALTVPAAVTIPAGQSRVVFTVTAPDNAARDGTRSVNVSAAAETFTGETKPVTVRDNEVASYRFGALTDIVNVSGPLAVSVMAADAEGNTIPGFSGTVSLSVVTSDGPALPLTPETVTLGGANGWSGNVTLPSLSSVPLKLRAADDAGNSGESTSFDVLRSLALPAADLLWDPARKVIYASVPASAGGAHANKVVAIDPVTLQVTGGVTTGQNPSHLALTSGGEALYAALDGNGTIAKINPDTLKVVSTFAIGTDPHYGTLYAADICPVAGQPDVLLVSQYRKSVSPSHNGVAVYDKGVRRPEKTQDHTGSNLIEPSSDPSIFFGYNTESTEFGFRRLKLQANGVSELEVNSGLMDGFFIDMHSEGDLVFSSSGIVVNGAQMRRIGNFGTHGRVRPDLASNRVYFLEGSPYSFGYCEKIAAYDPATFSLVRRLTLPAAVDSPSAFIRWGANGLAYRAEEKVYLLSSSQLVPGDPPADLSLTVETAPNPATAGSPLTYTVTVTNDGPNPARRAALNATLSEGQTLQSATAGAGAGAPVATGLRVNLPVGELASGASVSLTIVTLPQSAGALSITAGAASDAMDPDFTNNTASRLVAVGFVSDADTVNELRLSVNNLIHDPSRKLLWATLPGGTDSPLGKSIISIDPESGLVSDPLPINATPMPRSIALSASGRYLYVGLSDVPEIHRVDLNSPSRAATRVPLGLNEWGHTGYASDIEVLSGDGTSILVTTTGDDSAVVFDGVSRRTNRTGIYTVSRVEPTGTPGVFIGYNTNLSSFATSRLSVTDSGVAITSSINNLVDGTFDISASGNRMLASSGKLVNSSTLTLVADLGTPGAPHIDGAAGRAYVAAANSLLGFDLTDGAPFGSLPLPGAPAPWPPHGMDGPQVLERWGADGFAIQTNDKLWIARWSAAAAAPNPDTNRNRIPDQWEMAHFGALGVNPENDSDGDGITDCIEYLYASSPVRNSANPVRMTVEQGSQGGILHFVFPRRAGMESGLYDFQVSSDLKQWAASGPVTETVLSTQTADGVTIETVDAAIPCVSPECGFVRLRWIGQ